MFITNDSFIKGATAALANMPKEANPYRFVGQPLAMWNAGHDYIQLERGEAELNAEPLQSADKQPETQGRVAFAKGVRHEDNPYGFGDPHGTAEEVSTNAAHTSWDRSWRLAQEETEREPVPGVYSQFDPKRMVIGGKTLVAVPIVNQLGEQVGTSTLAIDKVEGFTDSHGTTWVPPTAWAYMAACRALHMTQDSLREQCASHDKRVTELLSEITALKGSQND